MRTKKQYLVAIFAIYFAACTNFKEDFVASGGVSLEISEKSLTSNAQELSVTVTSGEVWEVSSLPDWISIKSIGAYRASSVSSSKYDWEVSLSIKENTGNDRSGSMTFKSSSSTSSISFLQAGKAFGDGSLSKPYNPFAAYNLAQSLGVKAKSPEVFVKGIVSSIIYIFDSTHGTATFSISEDGTESEVQFSCYGVLYYGFQYWTEGGNQIAVGDEVVIYGKLMNYLGTTPESSDKEACIYSINGKTDGKGTPISVQSISLSSGSITMKEGEAAQLTATVHPSNASNKTVRWKSSNTSVATVSGSGFVKAVSEGTSTITAVTENGNYSETCSVIVSNKTTGKEIGHDWVNLGLSVKWATCNVGTSSPEGYGNYYAWGETNTKSSYAWETYKFWVSGGDSSDLSDNVIFSKYNTIYGYGTVDYKTCLELSDDVARQDWGGKWRIPSKEEWEELKTECTWTWTSQGGKDGYKVTGKYGSSIFLPAAGRMLGSSNWAAGSYGYYWSSSLWKDGPENAYHMWFDEEDGQNVSIEPRDWGLSVRPVTEW